VAQLPCFESTSDYEEEPEPPQRLSWSNLPSNITTSSNSPDNSSSNYNERSSSPVPPPMSAQSKPFASSPIRLPKAVNVHPNVASPAAPRTPASVSSLSVGDRSERSDAADSGRREILNLIRYVHEQQGPQANPVPAPQHPSQPDLSSFLLNARAALSQKRPALEGAIIDNRPRKRPRPSPGKKNVNFMAPVPFIDLTEEDQSNEVEKEVEFTAILHRKNGWRRMEIHGRGLKRTNVWVESGKRWPHMDYDDPDAAKMMKMPPLERPPDSKASEAKSSLT